MIGAAARAFGKSLATRGAGVSRRTFATETAQKDPAAIFREEVVYASILGTAGAAVWWFFASKDLNRTESFYKTLDAKNAEKEASE